MKIKIPGIEIQDVFSVHFSSSTKLNFDSNDSEENDIDEDVTEILDVVCDTSTSVISSKFTNSKKERVSIFIPFLDVSGNILPKHTNIRCKCCHHNFRHEPLGCPVEYICDNQDPRMKKITEFYEENNIKYDENDLYFFLCEGIFCSMECLKSYILEKLSINSKSAVYRDSLSNLSILANKLDVDINDINSSKNISMLECYGGVCNIDEYRKNNIVMKKTHNFSRPLLFFSNEVYKV